MRPNLKLEPSHVMPPLECFKQFELRVATALWAFEHDKSRDSSTLTNTVESFDNFAIQGGLQWLRVPGQPEADTSRAPVMLTCL